MLPLDMLVINDVNDRHGEVEGEPGPMSALFALRTELHMRNLTVDLVSSGEVYDPPQLVRNDTYVVADVTVASPA